MVDQPLISNLYAITQKLYIMIYSNILYCIVFCLSSLIAQKCYPELPICGKHPARPVFVSQSVRFDIDEYNGKPPAAIGDKSPMDTVLPITAKTRRSIGK